MPMLYTLSSVLIMSISAAHCIQNLVPPFSCEGVNEGFYCLADLTGYHHCNEQSDMTTRMCANNTRCSCQLNTKCAIDESLVCQTFQTMTFPRNFVIGFVGTHFASAQGEDNVTTNVMYEIRQDRDDERYYERKYSGKHEQEIALTTRNAAGTLYQYNRYYINTSQISCEKFPVDKFRGFDDTYKYYSLTPRHAAEILPTQMKFVDNIWSYKEEWTLKVGRLFPEQVSIYRYLIFDVNRSTKVRRPVYFEERTYGSTSEEFYTETILDVGVYFEGLNGPAWFYPPRDCVENF